MAVSGLVWGWVRERARTLAVGIGADPGSGSSLERTWWVDVCGLVCWVCDTEGCRGNSVVLGFDWDALRLSNLRLGRDGIVRGELRRPSFECAGQKLKGSQPLHERSEIEWLVVATVAGVAEARGEVLGTEFRDQKWIGRELEAFKRDGWLSCHRRAETRIIWPSGGQIGHSHEPHLTSLPNHIANGVDRLALRSPRHDSRRPQPHACALTTCSLDRVTKTGATC